MMDDIFNGLADFEIPAWASEDFQWLTGLMLVETEEWVDALMAGLVSVIGRTQ